MSDRLPQINGTVAGGRRLRCRGAHSTIVLKFGGSVLRSPADIDAAAAEIVRWRAVCDRVIAVCSAFEGVTDLLLRNVPADATAGARAMLLATGEFTTAALLALRLGPSAWLLSPHQLGLATSDGGADADPVAINADAFDNCCVAVVPGFIGVDAEGGYTLLGRGGSDLTAIFIAATLGARCRLIKDVDGLYDRDPKAAGHEPARRFATLSYRRALALDGSIVQHKAVRFARDHGCEFEVAAIGRDDATVVGELRDAFAAPSVASAALAAEVAHAR